METKDYPDLFVAADKESIRKQGAYFRLLLVQYLSLFVASVSTLFIPPFSPEQVLVFYVIVLSVGLLAALLLATQQPHQQWYQMRALAESCKTLTWRYMMAAEPFNATSTQSQASAVLAERLHELVSIQKLDTTVLVSDLSASEQATDEMKRVRDLDYLERYAHYLERRIDNQLSWYRTKSTQCKRASKRASWLVLLIYAAAILSAIFQVMNTYAQPAVFWVSEPLIVLAASFLGFAQAKRYAELSSSYALTALEIQKLRSGFLAIEDENAFSSYVNEAESAFSREHTQWIARVV